MPTELDCQSCETLVPTPESSAGESVTCPGCGARIFVPTTDAEDSIPLKLPSGINLDHRPGVFGESENPASKSESDSNEGGISEGIPRLAIAGSDDDSGSTIPLATPPTGAVSKPVRRRKPDNSTMIPRLPVLEKPASPDQATSQNDSSPDAIQLRPAGEPEIGVGVSDSLIDMITSEENRVWREERATRQAEEYEQKAIFRFGVLCCGLAMLVTITAGLPFVLAASDRTSEGSQPTIESKDQAAANTKDETEAAEVETETSDEGTSE
jgi:DNA-directed RNA polymerase subunit RPC12/RpoP